MKLKKSIISYVIIRFVIYVLVLTAISDLVFYGMTKVRLENDIDRKVDFIAERISFIATHSLEEGSTVFIEDFFELQLKDNDILGLIIYDNDDHYLMGKIKNRVNKIVDYDPIVEDAFLKNRVLKDIVKPIPKSHSFEGNIRIIVDNYKTNETLNNTTAFTAVFFIALSLVLVVLIFFGLFGRILRPIKYISEQALQVAEGKLSPIIKYTDREDELGRLVESLNYMITRFIQISEQLKGISNNLQVTASSNFSVAEEFTDEANNEASAIEQISSALVESASSIKNISKNTNQSSRSLSEGAAKANQGFKLVERIINSIEEISNSFANIKESLNFIDEVSGETDMLALNASIEAAKAGEFGKGFAVVAKEIRNLAEKSQGTSKEIAGRIEENNSIIENAKETIINSQVALKEILETTVSSDQILSEISIAITEQSKGQDEMTNSVNSINESMQKIVNIADKIKGSSVKIEEASRDLNSIVNIFKITETFSDKKEPEQIDSQEEKGEEAQK